MRIGKKISGLATSVREQEKTDLQTGSTHQWIFPLLLFFVAMGCTTTAWGLPTPNYLITNDDNAPKTVPNSSTFFPIDGSGYLQSPLHLEVYGSGLAGGYFTANRVVLLNDMTMQCAYYSAGAIAKISAVNLTTMQLSGLLTDAGAGDIAVENGVGLAQNGQYLYASFPTSSTIAAFALKAGCGLDYLGSVPVRGLQDGDIKGMAVNHDLLVVAYGDGSIQSFNVAAGIPSANADLQEATGYTTSRFPTGVDITEDGNYAIFGDMSTTTTVEVAKIIDGRLTTSRLYDLQPINAATPGGDSNVVMLSPDETLLYVVNSGSGQVTAAFFNKANGRIAPGCVSNQLKGFYSNWQFLGGMALWQNSGTGGVLYVTEYGASPSTIAALQVFSNSVQCSLMETNASPFNAPYSQSLLSIAVYPPRVF
jgi:sugar lactone lactonase YvrE